MCGISYSPVSPVPTGHFYILSVARAISHLCVVASNLTETQFIHLALTEFAEELIRQRQENIRAVKATASEELLRSYDYEIRKQTTSQTAAAFISFADYARYIDMKRLNRTGKSIPVDEIKDWIKEKGFDAFRRKPKDSQGNPLTGSRLLNALAWGIVRKKKGRIKNKRKAIQGGTENLYGRLIRQLARGYKDRTAEQIISQFQLGIV